MAESGPHTLGGELRRQSIATLVSMAVMVIAMYLILHLHLLAALLAGMVVHLIITRLGRHLTAHFSGWRRNAAILGLAIVVVGLMIPPVLALVNWLARVGSSWHDLAPYLQGLFNQARAQLPTSLLQYLPADVSEFQATLINWLHQHVAELKVAGTTALTTSVHLIVGMVLGALVAFESASARNNTRPLAMALKDRLEHFDEAFARVLLAQLHISIINTALTAVFIWAVLPAMGYPLPLSTALVVITFVAGLLPVVGNLISNAAVLLVALSVGFTPAVAALIFLVVVHKLEYFLNARLVGSQVQAAAWELLLAMIVLEAAFGLPGLVAAPIFYAYIKQELVQAGWV